MWGSSGSGKPEEHDERPRHPDHVVVTETADEFAQLGSLDPGGLSTIYRLDAMTGALHYEMAPFGLRFALIEPGRFETDFHSNIVSPPGWESSVYHERHLRFRAALTALDSGDTPADPEDVADAIIDRRRERRVGLHDIAKRRPTTSTSARTSTTGNV